MLARPLMIGKTRSLMLGHPLRGGVRALTRPMAWSPFSPTLIRSSPDHNALCLLARRPSCRGRKPILPRQLGWSAASQQNTNVGGTLWALHTEMGEECHPVPLHTEVAQCLTLVPWWSLSTQQEANDPGMTLRAE